MVKAGKMMWKLTTKANCKRDSKTGSNAILRCSPKDLPAFGLRRMATGASSL